MEIQPTILLSRRHSGAAVPPRRRRFKLSGRSPGDPRASPTGLVSLARCVPSVIIVGSQFLLGYTLSSRLETLVVLARLSHSCTASFVRRRTMSAQAVSVFCIFVSFILSTSYSQANGALLAERGRAYEREYNDNEVSATEADFFDFKTRPDIRALKWHITMNDEDALAPGYWFIAPYELLGQKERGAGWVGPYIYDGKGELVWSGVPMFDSFNIFDFRPIKINGEDMLTAIYKRADAGAILDNSFRIRKMVHWPGGYDAANMHEFTVFDEGTKALMLTLEHHELSKERSKELGFDGQCNINTNGLLELDISTSPPKTLFSFSLLDHLSLDEITYPTKPGAKRVKKECREGWDSNHCNAIDRFANGDFLVSCRHTDTIYKISRDKGAIEWRLGGTRSDFEFLGEAKFSRQHHARIREQNETHTIITLFDNARGEGIETATHDYTRGLILSLHDNVAEMIAEYPRPDHEYTTSRGSLEIMPNGNVFIGWTFHSRISEHTPDGRVLMKAKLPPKMNTYRSYKSPWVGKPIDPPDVYAQAQGEKSTDVFVSWNGATEVKTWRFYSSTAQGDILQPLKSVAKKGFETSTQLEG